MRVHMDMDPTSVIKWKDIEDQADQHTSCLHVLLFALNKNNYVDLFEIIGQLGKTSNEPKDS